MRLLLQWCFKLRPAPEKAQSPQRFHLAGPVTPQEVEPISSLIGAQPEIQEIRFG